jgi:hypothetical protein
LVRIILQLGDKMKNIVVFSKIILLSLFFLMIFSITNISPVSSAQKNWMTATWKETENGWVYTQAAPFYEGEYVTATVSSNGGQKVWYVSWSSQPTSMTWVPTYNQRVQVDRVEAIWQSWWVDHYCSLQSEYWITGTFCYSWPTAHGWSGPSPDYGYPPFPNVYYGKKF